MDLFTLKKFGLLALAVVVFSGLSAQNSAERRKPMTAETKAQIKQQKLQSQHQARTHTLSKQEVIQQEIQGLVAEIRQNLDNPAYDLEAAVARLRNSPHIMYPLNYYDPAFPIVYRTGDPVVDRENYNQAKQAYKAARQ